MVTAAALSVGAGDVVLVLVAFSLGFLIRSALGRDESSEVDATRRELMRYRRLGEPAAVLVLQTRYDLAMARRLRECFRVSEAVEVRCEASGITVQAVLDDRTLDREALERRLVAAVGDPLMSFGWARFPEDGVTLEVLVGVARVRREAGTEGYTRLPYRRLLLPRGQARAAAHTTAASVHAEEA